MDNDKIMLLRNNIVRIALKEVGYKEKPNNDTKYGEWFGLNHKPWCGIFVSWVYYQAGITLKGLGYQKGFAGCQTAMEAFIKRKLVTKQFNIGDIVFFDWKNDGKYDHVGIVANVYPELITIEGNTSKIDNSNGGGVLRRDDRPYSCCTFVNIIDQCIQ